MKINPAITKIVTEIVNEEEFILTRKEALFLRDVLGSTVRTEIAHKVAGGVNMSKMSTCEAENMHLKLYEILDHHFCTPFSK